jgi:tetratricopeptide (TPR) repeat protein
VEENMKKTAIFTLAFIIGLALSLQADVTGKVEGFVIDADNNPIQGAEITISSLKSSNIRFTIKSKIDGKFTQIGIWPGYYQVNCHKEGFMPNSTEIKVSIQESTKIQILLRKAEEAMEETLSTADKFFLKGIKLYEQDNFAEAAEAYEEAVRNNAEHWGYVFNLGLARKKMEAYDQAVEAFRRAAELNPDSFSVNKELGETLAKNEKHEDAKPYFAKATALNPEDADAQYNYGVVLTNLGDQEGALKAFKMTVEIQDDHADAYYQLATLQIGQAQTEEAIKNLEKFLVLAPEHAQAPLAKQLLDYLKK